MKQARLDGSPFKGDDLYHEAANQMTGGNWPLVQKIYFTFLRVNSFFISIFIRKRTGLNHFGMGNLFFAGVISAIYFLIASENWIQVNAHGNPNENHFSGGILLAHITLFNIVYLAKWIIASLSVRSTDVYWQRHRFSIGESLIYPTVFRLLKLVDFVNDGSQTDAKWKMSEGKWMQYCEPLIFILLGIIFKQVGFGLLGNVTILAAVCLFRSTFDAYTQSAMPRQADFEGKIIRPLIADKKTEAGKEPQKVIRD